MKPALTIIAACLVLFLAATPASAGREDERLDIYWIDVEGGAATLIVTPAGESVLIDTGNPGPRDPNRIVQTAVHQAHLRQLDHVIITHYHSDHFGGAALLATMLPIKHLHDNGVEGITELPDKAYLEFKTDRRSVITPGDQIELTAVADKNVARPTLRCIAAKQKFLAAPAGAAATPGCEEAKSKPIDTTDNVNSVVTLLSFGPFRFFDGGDLTWNAEKELVCPVNRIGRVDVYQTSHHGMDASNNPLVIRALEPVVAVFNNGSTKGCDPDTFHALKQTASLQAIYQVHRNLRGDGSPNAPNEYIANGTKDCKAQFLKLSVDPTGKEYRVEVPSTGHSRTYRTRG